MTLNDPTIHTVGGETLVAPAAAATTLPATVQASSPPVTQAATTEPAETTVPLFTVEHLVYLTLGALSLLAHVWALGARALHHDETLHATYSWFIFVGNGYMHDPLLHGPFLYYFSALQYFLFGDNDFTARLGIALFGTLLTVTPFLIRRELGRTAALLAAVYLLISPTFLYVGRFFRHDMYSMLFEMLVVVAIVRYASTRRALWLYLGMAAFALMYVNQETSYLFLLMMGTPLVFLLLWRTFKPGLLVVAGLGMALALLVFVFPGEAVVDGGHVAQRDPDTGEMVLAEAGPLFGWGPLATEDNAYALRIRNRADGANGSLFASLGAYLGDLGEFFFHPAIMIGTGLLLLSSAFLAWSIWFARDASGKSRWQHRLDAGDGIIGVYHSLAHGGRWLVALGLAFVIYALFFTAFLTNLLGVITGTTGSLLYWLAQHNVERGGQPEYYYLVLLAIYEPLLVIGSLLGIGLVAGGWLVRWRWPERFTAAYATDPPQPAADALPGEAEPARQPVQVPPSAPTALLPLLLVWWSITALGIYSWAGEKMPWLLVHIALPLTLLSAWAYQQVFHWGWQSYARFFRSSDDTSDTPQPGDVSWSVARWWSLAAYAGIFAMIMGIGYVRMTIAASNDMPAEVLAASSAGLLLLLTAGLVLLLVVGAGLLWGWRWSLAALTVCVLLTGSLYTIRNSHRINYVNGDVPTEMLIYTQTSPDVARVARRLKEVSRLRTNGLEMPVIYDNETVWQWYLRDFTNATRIGPQLPSAPGEEVQAVLMLQENLSRHPENRDMLEAEGFVLQRYPLRWWFPEGPMYDKGPDWRTRPLEEVALLSRVMRAPFNDATLVDTWNFLLHRDLHNAGLGSTDFVLAVRPDIADLMGPGVGAESRE